MGAEPRERLTPPIFASSDRAPDIYRTVRELETYAEAIDVENGEWHGFDSVGRPIVLTVEGDGVRVRAGIDPPPMGLADWLRSSDFLKTRRDEDWLRTASLADLVAAFDQEDRTWREQRISARFRRWLTGVIKGR